MFRFGLMISLVIFLMMATNHVANAQQDITPPALLDVRFEPEIIDTSKGPVTITVTVHVTDDLSGLVTLLLKFRNPGTTQESQVGFSASGLLEGDSLDGWYQNTMTLPQYSAFGTWEMYYFVPTDNVGNRVEVLRPANEEEARRGTDQWPTLYNGFVFAVGQEDLPQQPVRRLYVPSIVAN